MEPTSRLYQCVLCNKQVIICSRCDHGQIYCSGVCSKLARKKSLKVAGIRYQQTFIGKRNHAARQARYRKRLLQKVTHHGSLSTLLNVLIDMLENNAKQTENLHRNKPLTCHFCKVPVSDWLRNNFLRRKTQKITNILRALPQAP